MALTSHVFPSFQTALATKLVSLNGVDSIKVALSNAAGPITLATAGVSTANTLSDWTTNVAAEITGTGYTAGGNTLTSVTATAGGTNNSVLTLTGTVPNWTTATFTSNQAVFYDSTASRLICFWDYGGAIPVSAGTFTLTVNASGLVTATAS